MNKRVSASLLIILIVTAGLAAQESQTASGPPADRPIITVLDFTIDSVSESEMRSIINVLSSSLFRCGYFTVIDVSQREAILKEMRFSMSGCTDESCLLEVGKMLSAEGIVTGSVGMVGSRYVLSAKLMETETSATLSTFDGMYDTLDALMDGLGDVALELAVPYGSGGAVGKAGGGKGARPLGKKTLAWASLGTGVACAGTGAYFLAVSLPLLIDYVNAQKAYDEAVTGSDFDALRAARDAAQTAAIEGNANTNFYVGAGLAVAGIGLGVLSAILFAPPKTAAPEPPAPDDAGGVSVLPIPGGVLLGFHVRY